MNPDDPEAAERFQELVAAYNSIMGHLDFSSADEGFLEMSGYIPPKMVGIYLKGNYRLVNTKKHLWLLNCDRKLCELNLGCNSVYCVVSIERCLNT